MTDKQIQHTIETYHRKAMREPTKRLRAAIEQASKTRCWYNGWKHEGRLADYGVLYEPMRDFISKAQFSDICAMCEFLMAKANAQIKKSDDDGDCANQARYWMEKLRMISQRISHLIFGIIYGVRQRANRLTTLDWEKRHV